MKNTKSRIKPQKTQAPNSGPKLRPCCKETRGISRNSVKLTFIQFKVTIIVAPSQRCSSPSHRLPACRLLPACLPRDATLVDGSPCFPGHLCDEGHLARQDWWQADPPDGLPLLLHLLTLLPFRLIQDGRRQKSWRCQLSDFHPNKVYNLERSAGFDFQLET